MQNTYDQLPYIGRAYGKTHPQHLYTIAKLFQFPAVDFTNSRVLDLGCGDGSNLINIAYQLPSSTCLGVDASSVQIKKGTDMCAFAGIDNCRLKQVHILEFDPPHEFDYIICHGVYSWVSPKIQRRILNICRDFLSPNGIAYISYNTLPGWHQFHIYREMMKYHASKMTSMEEKIEQSKAIIQFVAEHVLRPNDSYGQFIKGHSDFISNLSDEYLFHEYLEEHNEALYFHQFIDRIRAFELQYLGDSSFHSMLPQNIPKDTQSILDNISHSLYDLEQYMDFLKSRLFRSSLIVKETHNIRREIHSSTFRNFYFQYTPEFVDEEDIEKTHSNDNETEETDSIKELPKHIMMVLKDTHPYIQSFDEIMSALARNESVDISNEQEDDILQALQNLFLQDQIDIHSLRTTFTTNISQTPLATPLARFQLKHQSITSSQLQIMVTVENEWIRDLIIQLDGTQTLPQIADYLLQQECFDLFDQTDSDFEIQDEEDGSDKEVELKKQKALLLHLQQILQTIASQGIILS